MSAAEIALAALVTLMGGGHIWTWLSARGKAHVDLITLGQAIAKATIESLQTDRAALLKEITDLKAEVKALGGKIDRQDDKIRVLTDDIGTLTEHIGKLEEEVRRLGGTPPARPPKRSTI